MAHFSKDGKTSMSLSPDEQKKELRARTADLVWIHDAVTVTRVTLPQKLGGGT